MRVKSDCQHLTTFGHPAHSVRNLIKSVATSLLYDFSLFSEAFEKHSSKLLNAFDDFSLHRQILFNSRPHLPFQALTTLQKILYTLELYSAPTKHRPYRCFDNRHRQRRCTSRIQRHRTAAQETQRNPKRPNDFSKFPNNALIPKIPIVTTADGDDIADINSYTKSPLPAAAIPP